MARAVKYNIALFGNSGSQHPRARLLLYGTNGNFVAWIHFWDPGVSLEPDIWNSAGYVTMNQPISMLATYVDLVRNESPIDVFFQNGRGLIGTTPPAEPVGEGEGA